MSDELITDFYAFFAQRDGEGMARCYAPDATFSDPAFPDLTGSGPGDMWRMLTTSGQDLVVELLGHSATATTGTAHWRATYTFSATGRRVVNDVHSAFTFADGLIATQVDRFDFWAWSRQALGPVGLLLGWSPLLRRKVRAQARANLRKFVDAAP